MPLLRDHWKQWQKLAPFHTYSLSDISQLEAPFEVFITPSFLDLLNSFRLGFSSVVGWGWTTHMHMHFSPGLSRTHRGRGLICYFFGANIFNFLSIGRVTVNAHLVISLTVFLQQWLMALISSHEIQLVTRLFSPQTLFFVE